MAELAFVFGVESLAQFGERRNLLGRAGQADLVALAGVAQVDGALEADGFIGETIAMQIAARLLLELGEHFGDLGGAELTDRRHPRTDVVVLDVGHQKAERGEHTGIERHDDAGHAEIARHARRMHRAGAAEREQHEVAQIMAAHGGNRLDRLFHFHFDDADDAFGGFGHAERQRLCDARDGCVGFGAIKLHAAAEEIAGAEIPEHEIAVGDGRFCAAAAVAGRPRHRAGALRPDFQRAEAVGSRDGPCCTGITVLMSIIGTARSRPSILPRLVKIGAPSLISATSQEVPPMSKVMMLENRSCGLPRDQRRLRRPGRTARW